MIWSVACEGEGQDASVGSPITVPVTHRNDGNCGIECADIASKSQMGLPGRRDAGSINQDGSPLTHTQLTSRPALSARPVMAAGQMAHGG